MKLEKSEYSLKELFKLKNNYICLVDNDSIINKHIVVLRDLDSAFRKSGNNSVDYITDDKSKYEDFLNFITITKKHNCHAFLVNDLAEYCYNLEITDWHNINKLIDYIKSEFGMIDFIIGNPPYGERGTGSLDLHYEITDILLDKYAEKMILVMPGRVGFSSSEKFDKWKRKFNGKLSEMEYVGNPFGKDANVEVDIFTFNAKPVDKVNVRGTIYNSLFDVDPFTSYERPFMEMLKSDFNKKYFKITDNDVSKLNRNIKKFAFPCTYNNGAKFGKAVYFSSITENIDVMTKKDFIEWNLAYKIAQKCAITNDSEIWLKNLKNAMKRPLLRFGLFKMQDDRHLTARVYKYIPDIDWSDDKTLTDVGILEMCGCNSTDAKNFSNYVTKFINELDSSSK